MQPLQATIRHGWTTCHFMLMTQLGSCYCCCSGGRVTVRRSIPLPASSSLSCFPLKRQHQHSYFPCVPPPACAGSEHDAFLGSMRLLD
ncbi:hypothetical protein COO60DRAFT_1549018 [Scenedesmus sp. NREL 46B-D3]|nr:hypothetical protein COO60DRAFT_1549018 [Scenedesmus sp. NREL 46B-D3]